MRRTAAARMPSHERIARRAVEVPRLADRHEGRNCVADDRQAKEAIPALRKRRQLEGQGANFAPIDQPGQGTIREDGYGERLVLPIARPQAGQAALGMNVLFGAFKQLAVFGELRHSGQMKRSTDEHRGGDVRVAQIGVAEAAVRVLLRAEIFNTAHNQGAELLTRWSECFGIPALY